jgi:hypothetical protein
MGWGEGAVSFLYRYIYLYASAPLILQLCAEHKNPTADRRKKYSLALQHLYLLGLPLNHSIMPIGNNLRLRMLVLAQSICS